MKEERSINHTDEFSEMLIRAIEQTADHVMITDKAGMIQYINPAFENTTGYAKDEVLGKNPRFLQSGEHPRQFYVHLWKTILEGQVFRCEMINRKKNGDLYIAEQTITPVKDNQGEIRHFVAVWKDITQKLKLQEQIRKEKHRLEEIIGFDEKVSSIRKFDRLFDFVADKALEILNAGKCSIMMVDEYSQELCVKSAKGFQEGIYQQKWKIGEPIAGLVAMNGKPLLIADIGQSPALQEHARVSDLGQSFMSVPIMIDNHLLGVINIAEKGESRQETFDALDLKILCAMSREVAVAIENVRMYKELHFLTIMDPLTSLYNFRYFNKTLEYEVKRANRLQSPLGLIMIDINHFKSYNDEFGHPEGNKLLKVVGRILQETVREIDIACRYGGDEFIVILPETGKEEARLVAERVRHSIANAIFKRPVTISLGIGMYVKGISRHELTSRADAALYQAKRDGKNAVCVCG